MVNCALCGERNTGENWCPRCKVVTEGILGDIVWKMPSSWANTRICNLLQPLYNRNKHERIQRIIEEFSSTKDISWALLGDDELSSAQQRVLLTAWKQYFNHAQLSAGKKHPRPISKVESRALLRGVALHDGTILSIIGNRILLDGVELPGNFPVEALAKAMTRRAKHGLPPTKFNWPLLIPTMSVLVADGNMKLRDRSIAAFARLIYAPENNLHVTVMNTQSVYQMAMNHNALVGAMGWLNWRQPQMSKDMIRPISLPHSRYYSTQIDGFHIHGKDWPQGSEPWVERWRIIDEEGVKLIPERRSAFFMRNGALLLRVLSESGRWIRTKLPHDPRLWALLASWALSPPQSRTYNMFMSLRWNWKNPRPEMNLPEPEVKALTLLRSICANNRDKVLIHDRKIMVHGRSGCAYGIDAKEGVHRAPFTIRAWPNPTSQSNGEEGHSLCIHTGTERRKLPLGDVIASVVLTLLDDTASANRINSLQQFIAGANDPTLARRHRHRRGHPLDNNPEWRHYYRQQRQNIGRIREYWRENADAWPDAQIRDADGQIRNIEVRFNANANANVAANAGIPIGRGNEVFLRDPNQNANDNNDDNDDNNEDDNARGGIGLAALRNYFHNREIVEVDGEEDHVEPQREVGEISQFGAIGPFGVGQNEAVHGEDAERMDDLVLNEAAFRELENNGHLQAGPAGVRTPRWTTLFPLLSRIFQAMPQGEVVRIPRVNGGLLQFESCGFQMNIRSDQEIEFVNRLAELMGWGISRVEQDNDQPDEAQNATIVWVREQAPNQDALAQITRILRPLQQELGQRAEAPWWWSFRRISVRLPEQLNLTWDMELSYADIGDDHADLIA
ncbi:MAG: hypothetical protein QGH90_02930 [Candidatus Poseidoniaceae archaeon]|nr:hypothetical protein [Candidatus Poseidoniaceae archaeon]